jgi:ATP-binding cassette subfamily G (WHITE) protein 8 (sterolin 2)
MNCIAGRNEKNISFEGSITFNGHRLNTGAMKELIGYVMQSDQLLPNLTVRETLQYAALLKLSSELSRKEKLSLVDNFSLFFWC